jgi:type IV pilus assembly protein PilO
MNLRFSKKETIILVLTVLVTIFLVAGGYFFYLSPKKQEIANKQTTLKSEQELLDTLKKQTAQKSSMSAKSIAVLQRKVPVKDQIEQLILDLEKAEIISGSVIKNMTFAEGEVSAPAQQNTQQQQEGNNDAQQSDANKQQDADADKQQNEDGVAGNSETASQQAVKTEQTGDNDQNKPASLPEGIKKVTVTLQVESSDYEELRKFIETLENLPRAIVVETVSFSSPGEITYLDTEEKKLNYSLTISAFYMPGLTDLVDKLPGLVTPPPANKSNPFPQFPDVVD